MKIIHIFIPTALAVTGMADEAKLPGHALGLEEAAQGADAICVAAFENTGHPDLGSLGSSYYQGAVISITRNLGRGEPPPETCTFTVQTVPDSSRENIPTTGTPYLIIGSVGSGVFRIAKIAEPDTANLALMDKLLRSQNPIPPVESKTEPQSENPPNEHGRGIIFWISLGAVMILLAVVIGITMRKMSGRPYPPT